MTHGGKRPGSGRPKGSNRYGEPTQPIRVPLSKLEQVKALITTSGYTKNLPLFSCSVRAGIPTPAADDSVYQYIDLNEHMVKNAASSFVVKASGDSMINAGINDGDLLVVDKSLTPITGKIVIAAVAGELTVKRLVIYENKIQLQAENDLYNAIDISDESSLVIHGVVTFVIHQAK